MRFAWNVLSATRYIYEIEIVGINDAIMRTTYATIKRNETKRNEKKKN